MTAEPEETPELVFNDYTSFMRVVHETIAEETQAQHAKKQLKRKHEAILTGTSDVMCQRDALRGDIELRLLRKTLDELGYERTLTQKQFHNNFISASLHSIYGEDFYRYQTRILAEHELEEACTEVLVCTPRRFGKTTSVSMFIAAMLWSVSEAWISVFSTGQRASSMLLDLTFKMIMKLEGAKGRILKKNQEELFLRDPDPTKPPRRLFSYPSSVGGTCPNAPVFIFFLFFFIFFFFFHIFIIFPWRNLSRKQHQMNSFV